MCGERGGSRGPARGDALCARRRVRVRSSSPYWPPHRRAGVTAEADVRAGSGASSTVAAAAAAAAAASSGVGVRVHPR